MNPATQSVYILPLTWGTKFPSHSKSLHHHLPPWIRSTDLFRHRRVAIVSYGVHDFFFHEVCSWGRV